MLTWESEVENIDSFLPRPKRNASVSWTSCLIGLSDERPILDHHAKAHIHEIRRISLKSGGFQVKSTHNLIKSIVSTKTIQFDECRREAMTLDFTGEICWISWVKSAGFYGWNPGEIRRISKDQLPGMVSPMFSFFIH